MPWTNTVDQRFAFVREVSAPNVNFSAVCRRYGISRTVGYRWRRRFEEGGKPALEDRTSKPKGNSRAYGPEAVDRILELRREYGWGPKKLHKLLLDENELERVPVASTIGEILKRHGVTEPQRRRRRATVRNGGRQLVQSQAPNDLWAIDYKGEFRLGNRKKCYPLTITDHFSRYVIACVGHPKIEMEAVIEVLESAFRTHGIPRYVRSDNGSPFGSVGLQGFSAFSVWLLKHGVCPEHIDPAHPEQNGRHERMHRTLKREVARPPQKDMRCQQQAFDAWRKRFNEVRPHESLGMSTPATVYESSSRSLGRARSPSYPGHYEVFRVKKKGHFHWKGTDVFVGAAFSGEPVGLVEEDDDQWLVYYGDLALGVLDARSLGRTPWLKVSALQPWRPETPEEPRSRG